jgi:hypothetical protein
MLQLLVILIYSSFGGCLPNFVVLIFLLYGQVVAKPVTHNIMNGGFSSSNSSSYHEQRPLGNEYLSNHPLFACGINSFMVILLSLYQHFFSSNGNWQMFIYKYSSWIGYQFRWLITCSAVHNNQYVNKIYLFIYFFSFFLFFWRFYTFFFPEQIGNK